MQTEVMTDEQKIVDYPKQVEKANYWKNEYDKVAIMLQEREKNYRKTNALKDKRIRELEQQLYNKNNSQGSLFNER